MLKKCFKWLLTNDIKTYCLMLLVIVWIKKYVDIFRLLLRLILKEWLDQLHGFFSLYAILIGQGFQKRLHLSDKLL